MPGATRVHLLRHAEHALQGRVLAGRMPEVPLSEAGQAQARALAHALAARPLAAVIASPVQRARETAEAIASRHGLAVQVEPGFDEVAFGDWTGAAFDALHVAPGWRAFNVFRGFAPVPGGEMMAEVQARALAALARLRTAHPDAEIAVVSHGDVLKSVLAALLGLPLDMMRRLDLAPASRSVVVLWDEDALVEAVNLPSHA